MPRRLPDWLRSAIGEESGQIALGALLVFVPILVLILSLMNTLRTTHGRVARQTAADASALAGAGAEARILNMISVNNVTMTYLVSEALAEEALLEVLPRLIAETEAELEAASVAEPYSAPAVALLELQLEVLTKANSTAQSVLPRFCAYPGTHGMPEGGSLFTEAKALELANRALELALGSAQPAALDAAERDGAREAVVWPLNGSLSIDQGRFQDLGDPARWGSHQSRDDFDPRMVRGYTPILRLDPDRGPLVAAEGTWRDRLQVLGGATFFPGSQYDGYCRIVYTEWFETPRESELLPCPARLSDLRTVDDIASFRRSAALVSLVRSRAEPVTGASLFRPGGDDDQFSYAQAEIYNGTSWDLYTQDWRARLVPASRLEDASSDADPLHAGGAAPPLLGVGLSKEAARWLNTR
jgi:hypothetical protein